MKGELGTKIMKKYAGLRAKIYIYLTDQDNKKKSETCKNCLEETELGKKYLMKKR